MNPMQLLMNQLQNQMKIRNPQMFQQFQNLTKNQNNPQEVLNNMIGKYTPEQMQQFRQFVNGFGISNDQLDNLGIKAK